MQINQITIKLLSLLALLQCMHSSATTFQLNANTSVLRTSPSNFNPLLPNDEISTPLVGTFDFEISPAPSYFIDKSIKYTTTLTNIDVQTLEGTPPQHFQSLDGYIRDDGTTFTGNGCTWFYLSGMGGSCSSVGPTIGYSGTFDGVNLIINGGTWRTMYDETYHIEASVLPEPSMVYLLIMGLGAIGLAYRKR